MARVSPASSNLAAEIYEDLRRRILSGELSAGERLPAERELSETYGTNRNTLREAFRKLEQERLITVRHGQGVTVADFRKTGQIAMLGAFLEHGSDPREKARALLDLLPARARVIELAMVIAAERADASDLARLSGVTELVVAAFEQGDDHAIAVGFQQWIDALIDAGHSLPWRWIANPFLQTERDIHERFPALYVREPSLPAFLQTALSALEKDDAVTARAATRAYFGRVDAQVAKMLEQGFGTTTERRRSRRQDA